MFTGRQMKPRAFETMSNTIKEQTAELERLRQQLSLSTGKGHPLSGITGYGARPQQFAKNNLLRMFQGRDPLPYNERISTAPIGSDQRSGSRPSDPVLPSRSETAASASGSEHQSTMVSEPSSTLGKRPGECSHPTLLQLD
jgi:hypothetical protein